MYMHKDHEPFVHLCTLYISIYSTVFIDTLTLFYEKTTLILFY